MAVGDYSPLATLRIDRIETELAIGAPVVIRSTVNYAVMLPSGEPVPKTLLIAAPQLPPAVQRAVDAGAAATIGLVQEKEGVVNLYRAEPPPRT